MPPPIAPLLAQALGLPPDQGEQALAEVVALIRQQLQATGEATIEGLGTFQHDGRALTFEPAEPLAEAVNHRYAGLPTVTRSGAPLDPPAARHQPATPEPTPEEAAPVDEGTDEHAEEYAPEEQSLLDEPVLWDPSNGAPPSSETREDPHEEEPHLDSALEPDTGFGGLVGWLDEPEADPSADEDSQTAPYADSLPTEHAAEASAPPPEDEPAAPGPTGDDDPLAGGFVPIDPAGWEPQPERTDPLHGGHRATFLDSGEEAPSQEEAPPADEEAAPEAPYDPPQEEEPRWLTEDESEHTWSPDAPPESTTTEELASEEQALAPRPEGTTGDEEDELDALLEGVWTPRTGPAGDDHPLGPMPEDLMEDADFSVIEGVGSAPPAEEPPEAAPPPPARLGASVDRPSYAPPGVPVPPPDPTPPPTAPLSVEPSDPPPPVLLPEEEAPRRRRRPAWVPYAVGALLLLLTALTILWWPRSAPPPTLAERPAATAPAPTPAPDPLPPPDGEGAFADPEEAPPPAQTEPQPPPPAADTPLRSTDGVVPARGGYTWIVASEATRAGADRVVERYRAEGYRASVLPADIRGRTAFRVGVGQFPTAADADRARGQLPPFAPADTWRLAL